MAIGTIEELRKRIGLAEDDASRDDDLLAAEVVALAMVETYLDRKLSYSYDIETFHRPTKEFLVRRWPLDPAEEILVEAIPTPPATPISLTPYMIDHERGIILFCGYAAGPPVAISYTGGFETFPADLQWALWAAFDAVWAGTPGFGSDPGTPVAGSTGAVKKVTLVGIGSVDMDTGSSSSGSDAGGGGSVEAWGIIPATAITFLNPYRRESVIGLGMSIIPSTAWLQATFAPLFELIDARGEDVVIRENTGPSTYTNHQPVKAQPKPAQLEDLLEGSLVKQGDFFLICRDGGDFPVDRRLEQKDRVTFRGRDWAVINDDANQYSIGGVVYARVLHVRG